jgi:hypothetical protein
VANIGIAGPVVFSLISDFTSHSRDDHNAHFAGWQVEHEEIHMIDATGLHGARRVEMDRFAKSLQEADYDDVRPEFLGRFFEESVLVAAATREGEPGTAIATLDSYHWVPRGNAARPLGPVESFYIHVGRRLLTSFNRNDP